MKRVLYILIALLTMQFSSSAQTAKVEAKLDSSFILIGQQLTLTLSATFPAQDSVSWPIILDTLIKDIEVVKKGSIDTSYDPNNITTKVLTQQLLLTSFDSGFYAIKPFQFTIGEEKLQTEPLLIQVQTIAIDTSKGIADIKEPYEVPFNLWSWIKKHKYWIMGILGAILIITGILIWLKKRKEKPVVPVKIVKPKIPPHKTALKKLKHVEQQKLWQSGKVKFYHSEVSEILREYIEGRYGVIALESTTPEIMNALRTLAIEEDLKEKLQQILTLSDLVKFAKEHPLPNENEMILKNAFLFVESTILKEANQPTEMKENG